MQIINKYITKNIIENSIISLLIITILFSLFSFLNELRSVGVNGYSLKNAFFYVVLISPENVAKLSSLAILIGTVTSLARLNNNKELVIIYSSSVSIFSLILKAVLIGVLFALFFSFLSELNYKFIKPYAVNYQSVSKGEQLIQDSQKIRLMNNNSFIIIEENLAGEKFKDITIYTLDDSNNLKSLLSAPTGQITEDKLKLNSPSIINLTNKELLEINRKYIDQYLSQVNLSSSQLKSMEKDAGDMTIYDLYLYIKFLESNQVNPFNYKLEFYKRLFAPIKIISILLLSIPLILSTERNQSIGTKIVLGVFIGLIFDLVMKFIYIIADNYQLNVFIVNFAPSIFISLFGIYIIKKKYGLK